MTSNATPAAALRSAPEKLRALAEVVRAEASLLAGTDQRLFAQAMTAERALTLRADELLAERVDAFVARFGRLQDTLGDKFLPALLDWQAETLGTAIDNLSRAERLGWVPSVDDWLQARRLRNRMIHEYVRDTEELARSLTAGHDAVPLLLHAAARMSALVLGQPEP